MKKNIFIFPDHKKINDHSSVSSYFLQKYLSKYFEIKSLGGYEDDKDFELAVKSRDPDAAIFASSNVFLKNIYNLLSQDVNVDFILTTNQRGFTKTLSKHSILEEISLKLKKQHKNIKYIAIHDSSTIDDYFEDILFISIPFDEKRKQTILERSSTRIIYSGWCADHEIFNPNSHKNGDLNIILDHAALQDFRKDVTQLYLEQIIKLKSKYPNKKINLCRINKGFEFYDFQNNIWTFDLSFRWWKSEYDKNFKNGEGCDIFQISECLNNSHIFCITHVESCGLTAIESLMAGCKIYVPSGDDRFFSKKTNQLKKYNGSFIKKELLFDYMDYNIFNIDKSNECFDLLEKDLLNYKNITNREKLIINNSWEYAAFRIYKNL